MKLISVNMEGYTHLDRIKSLISRERPDCLCLQEAPESFAGVLQTLEYKTQFATMRSCTNTDIIYNEGLMIASLHPFTARTTEYFAIGTPGNPTIVGDREIESKFLYIFSRINHPTGEIYNVATTHAMVTNDGLPDENQIAGVDCLLNLLEKETPHILCGDFNIPRGINFLYDTIATKYTDTIPSQYKSSLDRTLHRLGTATNLNAPIFDKYMVDYLFTKPTYQAIDVRLEFGISDHAAIIADIVKYAE